jgi:hypothetical protein
MKNNSIIRYSDLEREEIRIKKSIHKQEDELRARLKVLPEEIITLGIARIISVVISGKLFRTGKKILRSVISSFTGGNENERSERNHGLGGIIAGFVQDFINKRGKKE